MVLRGGNSLLILRLGFPSERGVSMKLVFIIGSGAVGKMTVGQELMKITDLRLFHNHMTIEPVIEIFGGYDGKTSKAFSSPMELNSIMSS